METVLKFIESSGEGAEGKHRNALTSRTMMKIAFIDRYWLADAEKQGIRTPRVEEMWRCRISRETNMGLNSGCFLVQPIHQVSPKELIKLVPGMYMSNFVRGRLIITPKPEFQDEGHTFLLPLYLRNHLSEEYQAYAVIVDLPLTPSEIKAKVFG